MILISSAAVLVSSCEKEMDFRYHDIAPLTVIEGMLTPEGVRVGITLTTPMDEPMDTTRLTDANATLYDLTSATSYALAPDSDSFYTCDITPEAGHVYRLSVGHGGHIYEAAARLYPPTRILSLEFNWIKMPYDHVAVLQGRIIDDPVSTGDCYWVKVYRNGKIYLWSELDDRGTEDGIKTFTFMTSRMDTEKEDVDEVLLDGDVITVTVSPVSREMHDYLEALANDSNGPAMFSGSTPGNTTETTPGCLGYFLATSPVSSTIVFHPDIIPYY